jgi:hypothetical protein
LARNGSNFAYEEGYLFHTLKGSLICRNILRHGTDGFISPPKEVVLRIFIAIKNPSFSAGVEPATGSNGKNANHYTTDDD